MEDIKTHKYSKDIRLINENHFLTLRKKVKKKEYFSQNEDVLKKFQTKDEIIDIQFDIKEIESNLNKEQLYNLYLKSTDNNQKLGYLMQMIIANDNNLILFGLYKINEFLKNYDKSEFESLNLKKEFNDNMFNYLFNILEKKYKENNFIQLLTLIVNKLCEYNSQYCILLINHIKKIMNFIIAINSEKKKNNFIIIELFMIVNNIFLLENFDQYKIILSNDNCQLLKIIIDEIYDLRNNDSIIIPKIFISILLSILNNIFINRIFFSNIFKNVDKIKHKERNIFDAIKYIIKNKITFELNESAIICLYNFIEYYMEFKEKLSEDEQDEINYRLCDMNIPKFIIPFIFDNRNNIINNELKIYIFKILINTINIGNPEYWDNLIEKKLVVQLEKLQNFLLNINIDSNSASIFEYHILLIFNLVSTEFEDVINNIAIKSSCISNLFKFFNSNNIWVNKQLDLFLNILHGLIKNKCKYRKRVCNFRYVKTLLISEGICEFFKKILVDEKCLNQDLIKNIFIDILVLIKYYEEFDENKNNNIFLLHLQKIGMNEVINNYKGKINYSNELFSIISEVSDKLLK